MSWAIYVRVSTSAQEERGTGLDVQEERCRAWAAERGLEIDRVYADVGSGALAERPELGALIVAARAGEHEGVIIPALDRLARDVIVQETLLGQLRKYGLVVRSVKDAENQVLDDPSTENDPTRRFVRIVLGAVAELERSLIGMRTHAARQRMIDQGLSVGGQNGVGFYVDKELRVKKLYPHLVDIVQDGLRLRELGVAYEAIGEFWLQAGFRPGPGTNGSWQLHAVKKKLAMARKWGYVPSTELSALAKLYVKGRVA